MSQVIATNVFEKTVDSGVSDGHSYSYHDYAGLTNFLQSVSQNCSHIMNLFSIGKSEQDRQLWTLRITDHPNIEESEPEFLYVGNMHGNEAVGREVLIHFIQDICDRYGVDHDVTTLVDETDIYIIVSMNPDGFELQTRNNAQGYDLNRNFPDQFKEPIHPRQSETKAVTSFIERKRFNLGANLHGGSLVCNYPWDGTKTKHLTGYVSISPDDTLYKHLCGIYSNNHPTMHNSAEFPGGITNGANWYVLYGGLQDYSYSQHEMLHVTLELSTVKFPPQTVLQTEWENNRVALYRYVEQVHRGVKGIVYCSCFDHPNNSTQHIPISAQLTFLGSDTKNIEGKPAAQVRSTRTDPLFGDYHRVLLPGSYQVNVKSKRCGSNHSITFTVPHPTVESGSDLIHQGAVRLDIYLKSSSCRHVHRADNDEDELLDDANVKLFIILVAIFLMIYGLKIYLNRELRVVYEIDSSIKTPQIEPSGKGEDGDLRVIA